MLVSDRIKKVDNALVVVTDENNPLVIQRVELNSIGYINLSFSAILSGESPTGNLVLLQPNIYFKFDFWIDSADLDGFGKVFNFNSDAQGGIDVRCLVFTNPDACDRLRLILGNIS